jgi:MFS superfamily sulfate permease-like transporter
VQGALFFGSTEKLLRRITHLAAEARYIVVDFKRVHMADTSARKLISRATQSMAGGETELVFAAIADDGPLGALARELAAHGRTVSRASFATPTRPSNGARISCSPARRKGPQGRNSPFPNSTCSRD